MVEMVEIHDGRLGKRSVERVRYVINNLLHLVIVKYGVISLILCIPTRLRLVTILSLLVKYLVIFHANPCNKSYIYTWTDPITLPCSLAARITKWCFILSSMEKVSWRVLCLDFSCVANCYLHKGKKEECVSNLVSNNSTTKDIKKWPL